MADMVLVFNPITSTFDYVASSDVSLILTRVSDTPSLGFDLLFDANGNVLTGIKF